jgi:hypothetical protein
MADNIKDIAFKEMKEPQIRLLICRTCKTAEELPDFEGPAEHDTLLNILVEAHQKPEPHIGLVFKFPVKYWSRKDVKESIMKQIQEGSSGLDVFGTNFYDTKSTFGEDAMKCFNVHMRPSAGCSDYKSDRKLLKAGTDKERRDAGLDTSAAPKVYLCDFCPAKMHYQKKSFDSKGLFK